MAAFYPSFDQQTSHSMINTFICPSSVERLEWLFNNPNKAQKELLTKYRELAKENEALETLIFTGPPTFIPEISSPGINGIAPEACLGSPVPSETCLQSTSLGVSGPGTNYITDALSGIVFPNRGLMPVGLSQPSSPGLADCDESKGSSGQQSDAMKRKKGRPNGSRNKQKRFLLSDTVEKGPLEKIKHSLQSEGRPVEVIAKIPPPPSSLVVGNKHPLPTATLPTPFMTKIPRLDAVHSMTSSSIPKDSQSKTPTSSLLKPRAQDPSTQSAATMIMQKLPATMVSQLPSGNILSANNSLPHSIPTNPAGSMNSLVSSPKTGGSTRIALAYTGSSTASFKLKMQPKIAPCPPGSLSTSFRSDPIKTPLHKPEPVFPIKLPISILPAVEKEKTKGTGTQETHGGVEALPKGQIFGPAVGIPKLSQAQMDTSESVPSLHSTQVIQMPEPSFIDLGCEESLFKSPSPPFSFDEKSSARACAGSHAKPSLGPKALLLNVTSQNELKFQAEDDASKPSSVTRTEQPHLTLRKNTALSMPTYHPRICQSENPVLHARNATQPENTNDSIYTSETRAFPCARKEQSETRPFSYSTFVASTTETSIQKEHHGNAKTNSSTAGHGYVEGSEVTPASNSVEENLISDEVLG